MAITLNESVRLAATSGIDATQPEEVKLRDMSINQDPPVLWHYKDALRNKILGRDVVPIGDERKFITHHTKK